MWDRRVYFEQMKGHGTRMLTPPSRTYWTTMRLASSASSQSERWSVSETHLQSVSGEDARAKTRFIPARRGIDAVGVCDGVRQHGDGVVKRSATARRLGLRSRSAGRPLGRRDSQSDRTESRPLDRQPTAPLKTLLQRVLFPDGRDKYTLTMLAGALHYA